MAKDYAKRVFTNSRARQKKRMRVQWFIVPILVIISAVGFWVWRSYAPEYQMLKKSWSAKKTPPIAAKTGPEQPSVHFDFYNELPNVQMNQLVESASFEEVPPTAVSNLTTPKVLNATSKDKADGKTKLTYILDLGTYKTSADASEQRISLLLSGCEAEIVKIKTEAGEIYRLQRGPFTSEAEGRKVQGQLQNKGILGELKKV